MVCEAKILRQALVSDASTRKKEDGNCFCIHFPISSHTQENSSSSFRFFFHLPPPHSESVCKKAKE